MRRSLFAATLTSTSFECKILFGSGGQAPRSLPTVTASSVVVLRTTSTEVPATFRSTVTDHDISRFTLLTATERVNYTATVTSDTKVVKTNGPTATFATATFSEYKCTGSHKPREKTTVTVYSGAYVPVPGQATALPTSYPTQVECQMTKHERVAAFQNVINGTATTTGDLVLTITNQATTTVPSIVTQATQTIWRTTVTEPSYTLKVASTTRTVPTECSEVMTFTKTYAAKCAPTNLVRDHDGQGLQGSSFDDANAKKLVVRQFHGDAPACCQLCAQSAECSAMEVDSGGSCSLYFNYDADWHPVCGSVGFTYRSQPDIWPGQGAWVQSGCGEARWLGSGQ
ncbi:hypothetical protein PG993_011623 [Apiospora rasikravindrae]|uniref:Apple domain-containing protein n=1 Tax=Apiospora rasikravindrae TaxID=990691 RepID=A0ABR1S1F5_9PEZI